MLIVLDRVRDFSTRIYTLAFYRVYHVMWTFVAESHTDSKLVIKNSKFLQESYSILNLEF